MNTSLIKSQPTGDFVEISVLMSDWENRIQTLINQNRPIKFDIYPRSDIFHTIQDQLANQGYSELIPENDRWLHYLVPKSR